MWLSMSLWDFMFMTNNITVFDHLIPPTDKEFKEISMFLHKHLEEFGDPRQDIELAMKYALQKDGKPGGMILTSHADNTLVGAVVMNKTGMNGYIPENILVYIATHSGYRGRGIGKQLMSQAIAVSDGDIALHVEPDNPARKLYESLGFTNKYLEMRLKK